MMWTWQITAGAAAIALLIGGASGYKIRDWQAIEAESKRQEKIKIVYKDRVVTNAEIGEENTKVQTEIRYQTRTLLKEVPVYVTKEADAKCVVPNGFIRLHDNAARGSNPGTVTGTDADASGIELSTVASTVIENYGTCRGWRQQVIGLQTYVRDVVKPEGLSR